MTREPISDAEIARFLVDTTEPPPAGLAASMKDLARAELVAQRTRVHDEPRAPADADALPVPVDRRTSRRARRFGVPLALAAAAAVVVVSAVVVATRGEGVLVTASPADSTRSGSSGNPVADAPWPAGLDGPTHSTTLDSSGDSAADAGSIALARDGQVAAVTTVTFGGVPADAVDDAAHFELADGRQASFVARGPRGVLAVQLTPTLTVIAWGASDAEDELVELVSALYPMGDWPASAPTLPSSWAVVDDPSGVAALVLGGQPPLDGSWVVESRTGHRSGEPVRSLSLLTTDTRAVTVGAVAELVGEYGEKVTLPTGDEAVLVSASFVATKSLMWSMPGGTIAVLVSEGLSGEELIDFASGVTRG